MAGDQSQYLSGTANAAVWPARKWRGPLMGAALLATIGLAAGLVAGLHARAAGQAKLGQAPRAELAALAVTLQPGQAKALLGAAKTCRAPLTYVVMWHNGGVPDSMIRIQSGPYVTPSFHLTARPEMVALPFPAPYPAGVGSLTFLGDSPEMNVQFAPGLIFASLAGAMPVSVFWDTGNPCR